MEWIKKKIKFIFTRNVSADQLTMSIAIGIVGGLFPIPFLTTGACLVLSIFISVNIPIMTTINLLVTPLELLLIPFFAMAGNSLKYYGYLLLGGQPEDLVLNIGDLMASLKSNAFEGVKEFSGVLLFAVFAWIIFLPIASFILYHALKPTVTKLIIKFKVERGE